MIEALKPCEKCGCEACFAMSKAEGGRVRVYCPKCGKTTTWRNGFDRASRAWNEANNS